MAARILVVSPERAERALVAALLAFAPGSGEIAQASDLAELLELLPAGPVAVIVIDPRSYGESFVHFQKVFEALLPQRMLVLHYTPNPGDNRLTEVHAVCRVTIDKRRAGWPAALAETVGDFLRPRPVLDDPPLGIAWSLLDLPLTTPVLVRAQAAWAQRSVNHDAETTGELLLGFQREGVRVRRRGVLFTRKALEASQSEAPPDTFGVVQISCQRRLSGQIAVSVRSFGEALRDEISALSLVLEERPYLLRVRITTEGSLPYAAMPYLDRIGSDAVLVIQFDALAQLAGTPGGLLAQRRWARYFAAYHVLLAKAQAPRRPADVWLLEALAVWWALRDQGIDDPEQVVSLAPVAVDAYLHDRLTGAFFLRFLDEQKADYRELLRQWPVPEEEDAFRALAALTGQSIASLLRDFFLKAYFQGRLVANPVEGQARRVVLAHASYVCWQLPPGNQNLEVNCGARKRHEIWLALVSSTRRTFVLPLGRHQTIRIDGGWDHVVIMNCGVQSRDEGPFHDDGVDVRILAAPEPVSIPASSGA